MRNVGYIFYFMQVNISFISSDKWFYGSFNFSCSYDNDY